jgi:F-type H+-transporting ATPase subunit gamma
MPGIKELKTRIKSIGSTRKITRAMQMVSAAKMRRAQQAALNSRSYSDLAWQLIRNLSGNSSGPISTSAAEERSINNRFLPSVEMGDNKLLKTYPKATKTAIIVISTNTGLVGGFNSNLFAKLREIDRSNRTNITDPSNMPNSSYDIAELFGMGRKAKDYAVRFNKNLKADFPKADVWVSIDKIYPLARMISDLYQTGEYKAIYIIYNQFISTLSQKATVKQLLPFAPNSQPETRNSPMDFLFEPSPELVLKHLLPRIIESQIYQAVLESDAGEHSARMVTMKNATEAAGDLISDLTLTFNQLRQNKITTELAEITAGKIALE